MTREQLIDRLADAIARMEGYYARTRRPTLAQRLANPGNVRRWRAGDGAPYPMQAGYVDFVAWARARYPGASEPEVRQRATAEGWRVLRTLIGRYIDGRYTSGRPPTIQEMFEVYAPASDRNNPTHYAAYVAQRLGARPTDRLIDLIEA